MLHYFEDNRNSHFNYWHYLIFNTIYYIHTYILTYFVLVFYTTKLHCEFFFASLQIIFILIWGYLLVNINLKMWRFICLWTSCKYLYWIENGGKLVVNYCFRSLISTHQEVLYEKLAVYPEVNDCWRKGYRICNGRIIIMWNIYIQLMHECPAILKNISFNIA